MEKLDVLMLKAGEVVHYNGIPLQLPEHTRVLGRKKNFKMDFHGIYIEDSIIPQPIKVNADGSAAE